MRWEVHHPDGEIEDVTDKVNAAIAREAKLNKMTSGRRSADVRDGSEVYPLEPIDEDLN